MEEDLEKATVEAALTFYNESCNDMQVGQGMKAVKSRKKLRAHGKGVNVWSSVDRNNISKDADRIWAAYNEDDNACIDEKVKNRPHECFCMMSSRVTASYMYHVICL